MLTFDRAECGQVPRLSLAYAFNLLNIRLYLYVTLSPSFQCIKSALFNVLASLYLWTLSLEFRRESALHWYDLSQNKVKEQFSIW